MISGYDVHGIKTVCVFCGSSKTVDKAFYDTAIEFADLCCDFNIRVQYGGGAIGLMGSLAERILERGGHIKGIIPQFMHDRKWAHHRVKEMIVVQDMRERKRQMIDKTDAVVVLPGGIGTLEELMEVSTLKQLGLFDKPIFVVNTKNYFGTFLVFLQEMIHHGFLREEDRNIWEIIDKPADFLTVFGK
jgi:hypothetical protein